MAKEKNGPEGFEPPDEMDDTGAAPAGFKLAIEDDRYFWVKDKKNPCQGILMSRSARGDGNGYQYTIELTKPCKAVTGSGTEGGKPKEITVQPGSHIVVDETHSLQEMQGILKMSQDRNRAIEVYILPVEKRKLKGGRSVWRIKVYAKSLKIPCPIAGSVDSVDVEASKDGDEIPF